MKNYFINRRKKQTTTHNPWGNHHSVLAKLLGDRILEKNNLMLAQQTIEQKYQTAGKILAKALSQPPTEQRQAAYGHALGKQLTYRFFGQLLKQRRHHWSELSVEYQLYACLNHATDFYNEASDLLENEEEEELAADLPLTEGMLEASNFLRQFFRNLAETLSNEGTAELDELTRQREELYAQDSRE
ncbi:hypothetical protein [Microscilla marina]|uniref:Uncharacterized protein n=1 Tax=Microscilla marina ATCC 23134 TaxID=313606 RepID=A1ZN91_MICM2|nr:hypothetical protein [Microscilla marina]EAY28272.1 hypothetical protein M23134_03533 [Microscilla marina ATCC 23134]